MATRQAVVNPESKAAYDNFHFAPATWAGDTLHCSGIIGTGADGTVPDAFADEAKNAWEALGKVLAEAGLGYDDVVEFTTFHVGLQATLADFMQVKDQYVSEPWPAWTAIGCTELAVPGARLELRVTAARNAGN